MEQSQVIQATLSAPDDRSDKLIYLVQIDVQESSGTNEEMSALAVATRMAQGLIAGAFPGCNLVWEAPLAFDGTTPTYDPLYKMGGMKVWIMPVVSRNEAYFYLVG